MEIKIPKGTIIKVSGSAFHLRHSMCVEIIDEQADTYIGRLVEVKDDETGMGNKHLPNMPNNE